MKNAKLLAVLSLLGTYQGYAMDFVPYNENPSYRNYDRYENRVTPAYQKSERRKKDETPIRDFFLTSSDQGADARLGYLAGDKSYQNAPLVLPNDELPNSISSFTSGAKEVFNCMKIPFIYTGKFFYSLFMMIANLKTLRKSRGK